MKQSKKETVAKWRKLYQLKLNGLLKIFSWVCNNVTPNFINNMNHYLLTDCNILHKQWCPSVTFIRGNGGAKISLTNFPRVTSTNVRTSPKNFLTFSFNPFATLVWNVKAISSASHKLLNFNQDHPSKKSGFSGQILIKLRLW